MVKFQYFFSCFFIKIKKLKSTCSSSDSCHFLNCLRQVLASLVQFGVKLKKICLRQNHIEQPCPKKKKNNYSIFLILQSFKDTSKSISYRNVVVKFFCFSWSWRDCSKWYIFTFLNFVNEFFEIIDSLELFIQEVITVWRANIFVLRNIGDLFEQRAREVNRIK